MWTPHGSTIPPLGRDRINWKHPFARKFLIGAWWNHTIARGQSPAFSTLNEDVIPRYGSLKPRLCSTSGSSRAYNAEGGAYYCSSTTHYIGFGADPIPAAQVTICLVRRKTDTTFRNPGTCFCITNSFNPADWIYRCNVYLPFSDGNAYWDYGGVVSGTTRLQVGSLSYPTTRTDKWILTAGPRGMAMWQNGIKVGSHTTASPGRTVDASRSWFLGFGQTGGSDEGDIQEFNYVAVYDDQWDDAKCRAWSAEPYAHLYNDEFSTRQISFPVAAGIGSFAGMDSWA